MNLIEPELREHATIYGHNVWHYCLDTTLGEYHIVQYEGAGMCISEQIVTDNSKAEKMFKKICRDFLDGKYL